MKRRTKKDLEQEIQELHKVLGIYLSRDIFPDASTLSKDEIKCLTLYKFKYNKEKVLLLGKIIKKKI